MLPSPQKGLPVVSLWKPIIVSGWSVSSTVPRVTLNISLSPRRPNQLRGRRFLSLIPTWGCPGYGTDFPWCMGQSLRGDRRRRSTRFCPSWLVETGNCQMHAWGLGLPTHPWSGPAQPSPLGCCPPVAAAASLAELCKCPFTTVHWRAALIAPSFPCPCISSLKAESGFWSMPLILSYQTDSSSSLPPAS